MLAKVQVLDKVEVLEDGTVLVRHATYVTENGVRITSPIYHRESFVPGSDTSRVNARVAAIAGVVWTTEVVKAYRDRIAAEEAAEAARRASTR